MRDHPAQLAVGLDPWVYDHRQRVEVLRPKRTLGLVNPGCPVHDVFMDHPGDA